MPTAVVSCCIEFNLGLAAASLLSSESYVWVWSSTILTLTFPRELCPWLVFQGKYYSIQARLLLLILVSCKDTAQNYNHDTTLHAT